MATFVGDSPPHTSLYIAPDESAAVQQVLVSNALSYRMAEEPGTEPSIETASPFSLLERYFSDRVKVIADIAAETISHLQSCHLRIAESAPSSEDLLELNANIQFLQAVIDIEQAIPRSFKASFPSGLSKELIPPSLKERIEYIHSSCDYNLKLYTDIFNKHADQMLTELGWDLDQNKDEIALIKKWTYRMIVPIYLSNIREISMQYPWKNYVIDNRITPNDCKIIERISRLPSNAESEERFTCPIGAGVMAFPMKTPCGHIFDNHTLISALRTNGECPMDRRIVKQSELLPAEELRAEIHQWLKSQFVTITVHANLKEDNFLAIRGNDKAGLSWDKGLPLKMVEPGVWATEIPYVEECHYKVLINDSTTLWESGENHKITERGDQDITPVFPSNCDCIKSML